ncbi:hypothetical protein C1645_743679 [Glomus cerebriforme]|uniref:Uncharacterized protein n=1 Tax=Glomus cerebriforme TaxID=658196 RepID=A0A397SF41_9GLOM|nr:hypothetical protein C1645_743679 [Glomus cerebriforme]
MERHHPMCKLTKEEAFIIYEDMPDFNTKEMRFVPLVENMKHIEEMAHLVFTEEEFHESYKEESNNRVEFVSGCINIVECNPGSLMILNKDQHKDEQHDNQHDNHHDDVEQYLAELYEDFIDFFSSIPEEQQFEESKASNDQPNINVTTPSEVQCEHEDEEKLYLADLYEDYVQFFSEDSSNDQTDVNVTTPSEVQPEHEDEEKLFLADLYEDFIDFFSSIPEEQQFEESKASNVQREHEDEKKLYLAELYKDFVQFFSEEYGNNQFDIKLTCCSEIQYKSDINNYIAELYNYFLDFYSFGYKNEGCDFTSSVETMQSVEDNKVINIHVNFGFEESKRHDLDIRCYSKCNTSSTVNHGIENILCRSSSIPTVYKFSKIRNCIINN